jgi:hypothetical protein
MGYRWYDPILECVRTEGWRVFFLSAVSLGLVLTWEVLTWPIRTLSQRPSAATGSGCGGPNSGPGSPGG